MNDLLRDLIYRYPKLDVCSCDINEAFINLCEVYCKKKKMLIAGNGGSSSDADHIAGELLKSFRKHSHPIKICSNISKHLQNALPAIPLGNLSGIFTSFSNDCEPAWVFGQLVYALGEKDDCLVAISTSGNSLNILNAAEVAKEMNIKVIGLTGGRSDCKLKQLCDICICVPEIETFKVQELHLPIYHCICAMVEEHFFDDKKNSIAKL